MIFPCSSCYCTVMLSRPTSSTPNISPREAFINTPDALCRIDTLYSLDSIIKGEILMQRRDE